MLRHAEADETQRNLAERALTNKGERDSILIAHIIRERYQIGRIISSPFKRALDTVAPLCNMTGISLETSDLLREKTISARWIDGLDYPSYVESQWVDPNYRYDETGENCLDAALRYETCISRLDSCDDSDKLTLLGVHGSALCSYLRQIGMLNDVELYRFILSQKPILIDLDLEKRSLGFVLLA